MSCPGVWSWKWHRVAAALALAVAVPVGLVGCGGGGDTPSPTPAVSPGTGAVTPPGMTVTDGVVRSDLGYRTANPDGWLVQRSGSGMSSLDLFVEPNPEGLPKWIGVSCRRTDSERAILTATARAAEKVSSEPGPVVAGVSSESLVYTIGQGAQAVTRKDVVFTTGGCTWVLSAAAAPGTLAEVEPAFSRFLAAFRLEGG